jgi:hypothetical protein
MNNSPHEHNSSEGLTATGPPPATPTGPAEIVTGHKAVMTEGEGWTKRLKRTAWQATGIYLWARLIAALFGGGHLAHAASLYFASQIISVLNSWGFAPVGASHLGIVLKVGWALAITGFSGSQLLGLALYVVFFPAWFPLYIVFRKKILEAYRDAAIKANRSGLLARSNRWPLVTICGSGLLGWYVLFGEAPTTKTIWAAVALSGAFFVLLTYRAFRRAAPIDDSDPTPLNVIDTVSTAVINMMGKTIQNVEEKRLTIASVRINKGIYGFLGWIFVNLAATLRGRRGRSLISSIAVLYYSLSLVFLAGSAVLFWAFVIKTVSASASSFEDCLIASTSHFLPGVSPTGALVPPTWAVLGPGITAWVLLGVYLSASTSLLPGRVSAYIQRGKSTYSRVRTCLKCIHLIVRMFNSASVKPVEPLPAPETKQNVSP